MTGYELRRHLADTHDIPTRGLTYEDMTALHQYEHRPGVVEDHHHEAGS
jgi:hypothetical protein